MALRDLEPDDPSPARGRRSVDGPLTRTAALWRKRDVLALLVRRDLKVRYADAILGYVWSVLDPLMMALVYWFIFATIFNRNVGEEPYLLYLLAGMLPFRWYQHVVTGAAGAIKGERLVRSTALPREIWILRSVFSKGAEYVFSLPVLAVFIIAYRKGINWEIIYMIPAALIEIVLATGLALLLSAIGALYRDVDRVMHIIMQFMFYATPIIYGLNNVLDNPKMPEFLKVLYAVNPMTGIVSLYRAGLFPAELHLEMVLSSIAGSIIALVVGWWVFIRLEPAVLKEI